MVRKTRSPFLQRTIKTTKVFEIQYVYLWGPYHTPTHDNLYYFITMIADYSRSTWAQLLRYKSNVLYTCNAPGVQPGQYAVLTVTTSDYKIIHELVPAVTTE